MDAMNDRKRFHEHLGATIIQQMGGAALIRLMTGANLEVGTLSFRNSERGGAAITLPYEAHNDINRVVITYDEAWDVYTMQAFAGTNEVETIEWVYWEDLMDRFEEMTYVYLTLTPRLPPSSTNSVFLEEGK